MILKSELPTHALHMYLIFYLRKFSHLWSVNGSMLLPTWPCRNGIKIQEWVITLHNNNNNNNKNMKNGAKTKSIFPFAVHSIWAPSNPRLKFLTFCLLRQNPKSLLWQFEWKFWTQTKNIYINFNSLLLFINPKFYIIPPNPKWTHYSTLQIETTRSWSIHQNGAQQRKCPSTANQQPSCSISPGPVIQEKL